MEKLEFIWIYNTPSHLKEQFGKNDLSSLKPEDHGHILTQLDLRFEQIVKRYPDEFVDCIGSTCSLCKKKFAVDPTF